MEALHGATPHRVCGMSAMSIPVIVTKPRNCNPLCPLSIVLWDCPLNLLGIRSDRNRKRWCNPAWTSPIGEVIEYL
jgi:hypothetical protein